MHENILIVEDDSNVSEALTDVLVSYEYQVSCCSSQEEVLKQYQKEQIDFIILDVNLGKDNGFDICKEIRKLSQVPILFLTGCSSELELIRGFQTGGDDYLTKPFRMQELLVRIQALIRRCASQKAVVYETGNLSINLYEHQILKNEKLMDLSITEYKIITKLVESWPKTLTRENLLYYIWDKDSMYVEDNTLNVNISRIREKLGVFDNTPYIATVRGIGYRWSIPVRGR